MFNTFSDGFICPGVNALLIGVDPGAHVALAVRSLLLEDPTIHVPMAGLATPIFRHTENHIREQAIKATEEGKPRGAMASAVLDHIQESWPTAVSELEAIADRFPTLSARVIESDDMLKLLAAFGVTQKPGEPLVLTPAQECLIELNNTINLREMSAACPFHGLHAYDLLSPITNEMLTGWFADKDSAADLSITVLQLLAALTFIRFATSMPSVKLVTSITTERTARTLAAADAIRKLASIVAAVTVVPKLARIHSLMSFVTSDLAVDALRDEEGIRLRTALLTKFATVDGIDLLGIGAEMKAFFAPRSIKVNGQAFPQYQLPVRLATKIRKLAVGLTVDEEGVDKESIPHFSTTNPGMWAVTSPRDALATRSQLFDIKYISGRAPQLNIIKEIITAVHAAMHDASTLLDELAKDDMLAVVPGGTATIRAATSMLPTGSPVLRFGAKVTNDPANDVPAVVSGNMSSFGAIEPADLKQRPLVPPVIGSGGNAISETDIASLGGMYITALPSRLGQLKATEAVYVDVARPVVPLFIPTNPVQATGFWPLMESAKFYQLYPHCYAPHLTNPVLGLSISGLSQLISDLQGYAALNILRRDTVPDLRFCSSKDGSILKTAQDPNVVVESRVATAMRFVGMVVSITGGLPSKEYAGKPGAFAEKLFSLMKEGNAAAPNDLEKRLLVARPDVGYGKFLARSNQNWPTDPASLAKWIRYSTAEQLALVTTELSMDGSWWFVASSYVPPLLPFDGNRLDVRLSAATDEVCKQQDVDSYRIIGRPGYKAHLAATAYSVVLSNKDKPEASAAHVPYTNKPWRNVYPAGPALEAAKESWWPTGGIVVVDSDVRATLPMCLRAGVRNSRDIHFLIERSVNGLPKARAEVPSGTVFMTDEPPTPLSKTTLKPQQHSMGVAVSTSDWVAGYTDPTKVSTVSVI